MLDAASSSFAGRRPNILYILADDLGWNDVSWHNPGMPTPVLERLAKSGVILEQSYVQQVREKRIFGFFLKGPSLL